MAGDGLYSTRGRIRPERVGTPFALEDAAVESQVPEQLAPLHASALGYVADFHSNLLALGFGWNSTEAILATILKHQGDRF